MRYSLIIPVYNRPDEVDELLKSLCEQTFTDFDVHVVEDGSDIPCKEVCDSYSSRLNIHYYTKENGGPGAARNYGAERAGGEYFIVLDSDVVLPPGYLAAIEQELQEAAADAFGGPDRSHPDFTPVQKAISYAMTSFFTTGGIRGGKKKLDKFYPRSFNMGVSASLWRQLGGFRAMRFGEDIDFSIRIFDVGARCRLFPEAWVWHKRRTDFRKFFRQVRNSGIARINLHLLHPGSMKLVHMLPAVFTIGVAALAAICLTGLLFACIGLVASSQQGCNPAPVVVAFGLSLMALSLSPLLLYSLLICLDSTVQNKSLWVGLLSVPASFVQLIGYGTGFLSAAWKRLVLRREGEHFDFESNQKFYK
ncbi:MAG: glycosyltransferase [Bacteroidaceae bacterium]|nr:glycosyltransferase [Bacteroidaceae bacterium]